MPRVMCVHFPSWSLQRLQHQQPALRAKPLALTRPAVNQGRKVIACCPKARRQGIRPGMLQAEALATLPALTCVEEDLDADRQALTELAEWSQQFSPIVALEDVIAPTCLLIDTTGGDACFGGEERMLQKTHEAFRQNGWSVAIALADTIGAAWAVSHCLDVVARTAPSPPAPLPRRGEGRNAIALIRTSEHPQQLRTLPVTALRLSTPALVILNQLGIERIEQLLTLPRGQVADRFGDEVGLRLDQALGDAAEVLTPFHGQPEATASWAFEEPIERRDIVVMMLDRLLERLQSILQKRCCGTRLVECTLEQEVGHSQRFECSLSRPAQTATYLRPLLHVRLEQLRLQAAVRAMRVRALVLERMPHEQRDLFETDGGADGIVLPQLLDSLVARLGRGAVSKARFVADPQPELACRLECALDGDTDGMEMPVFAHRPLRLFARPISIHVMAIVPDGKPVRFHHAGVDQVVAYCQGPERIETGWWRGDAVRRDYYIVETKHGTRWWIFRCVDDGRWFLHGCFD